jgi:N-acetylated-alpha-linked acidic dipeptidase
MLGMGSDYTAFVDHLGIASANVSFGGESPSSNGIYHSIYDDFYWYTHFCKDCFEYGRAMAQTDGKIVLRMADADILPYDFAALARSLRRYDSDVKNLLKKQQTEAKDRNAALSLHAYKLTSNPAQPMPVPPPKLETPPALDFTPLDSAIAALKKSADHFNRARAQALQAGVSATKLKAMNQELTQAARKLQAPKGLPGRTWYRNTIFAPGWYSGYSARALPGIWLALLDNRYTEASQQIGVAARVIQKEAAYVEHIAAQLEQMSSADQTASDTPS